MIVDIVRRMVGSSLAAHSDRESELRRFLARPLPGGTTIDDPGEWWPGVSDCGLFAFAVWYEAGVKHSLLTQPYHTGMAITWLQRIARDLDAVRHHDDPPTPGALLHYFTKGKNNNHVEFVLDPVTGEHAGGGRPQGAISSGTSPNLLWSSGRPLQEWYDPTALLGE